jgi:hypothetical protein
MDSKNHHRLLVGIDRYGQLAWLGEKDSGGRPVGYIDEHRQCWLNVTEHDLTVSARAIHRRLEIETAPTERRRWPLLLRLAEKYCHRDSNRQLAVISGLAAISASRRLSSKINDPLLGQFLVDSVLGRADFSSGSDLKKAFDSWLDDLSQQ